MSKGDQNMRFPNIFRMLGEYEKVAFRKGIDEVLSQGIFGEDEGGRKVVWDRFVDHMDEFCVFGWVDIDSKEGMGKSDVGAKEGVLRVEKKKGKGKGGAEKKEREKAKTGGKSVLDSVFDRQGGRKDFIMLVFDVSPLGGLEWRLYTSSVRLSRMIATEDEGHVFCESCDKFFDTSVINCVDRSI